MFRPPEDQEWFIPLDETNAHQSESHDVSTPQPAIALVDKHIESSEMLPYLSPTSLFADEGEMVQKRAAINWGEYDKGSSTRQEVLQRWQEQESESSSNPNYITPVVPTHSKATTEGPSAYATSNQEPTTRGKDVIPKLSKRTVLSSKVNVLTPKVSSPARAILPKPPGPDQNPHLFSNTGVSKPQKKKK